MLSKNIDISKNLATIKLLREWGADPNEHVHNLHLDVHSHAAKNYALNSKKCDVDDLKEMADKTSPEYQKLADKIKRADPVIQALEDPLLHS